MSEKYEDLRAKFDAEMRDRIENPLKHMARRDLADELQHCIDDTNVGQPNRYVSVSLLERAISRIRELEDDRDSWAEQASQRVADWQREHDLRVAAERRVGELERASQNGGGEAERIDAERYRYIRDGYHYDVLQSAIQEGGEILDDAVDACMQFGTPTANAEIGVGGRQEYSETVIKNWKALHGIGLDDRDLRCAFEEAAAHGFYARQQTLLALLTRVLNYHHYYGSRILPKELVVAIDAARAAMGGKE